MAVDPISVTLGKIVLDKLWDSIQEFGKKQMGYVADAALDDAILRLGDVFGGVTRPTTALVGFGHCGKAILTQLADQFADAEADPKESPANGSAPNWVKQVREVFAKSRTDIDVRDLKPLIVVGDLDDSSSSHATPSYSLYRDLGLRTLAIAGTGNLPAKAQFLARIALSTGHLPAEGGFPWQSARAALIDSLGADARNRLRLVVYVFSTGGGSGSGFLYEIAQAQRFKQIQRLASPTPTMASGETPDIAFTLGVAVMPGISPSVDAQSLNTGRLLCRYLSDRWDATENDEIRAIPAYHSMILFSNGSFQSEAALDEQIKESNEYIADQLLTAVFAQDVGKDAEKRLRTTSSQDQIRLDPSDLRHAICGISVVGFSAQADAGDVGRNLVLALGKPRRVGSRFVGISVDASTFDIVQDCESKKISNDDAIAKLSNLPVFKYCPGVTVVISGSVAQLTGQVEVELKRHLANLFPNARVRRHAVIEGEPSLTIYLSESGIFTEEARRHLANYLYNCFLDEAGEVAQTIESLTTVIGGECKPLAIAEAEVFLSNVAAKLDVKAKGTGLIDVLVNERQARNCLRYMQKLQTLQNLKEGLPHLEEWLATSGGKFERLFASKQ